jgi:hypothetical protein
MRQRRLPFQLAKDGVLVREEILQQSHIEFLVHAQASLLFGSHNARRQNSCKLGGISIIGAGQIDQSREMCHESVKSGDVSKT